MRVALGIVLSIFSLPVLLRLVSGGILLLLLGLGLVCLCVVTWLVQFIIFELLFLMLGVIRLLLIEVGELVFGVVLFWMFMALCSSSILLMLEKETRLCFVASWLVVSGMVFFLVMFVVKLFLVGSVGLLTMMVICFGNVPFLLVVEIRESPEFS